MLNGMLDGSGGLDQPIWLSSIVSVVFGMSVWLPARDFINWKALSNWRLEAAQRESSDVINAIVIGTSCQRDLTMRNKSKSGQ